MNNLEWNATEWLNSFNEASETRNREMLHNVREIVFRNTQQIVANGGYKNNGKEITITDPPRSIWGSSVIQNLVPGSIENTIISVIPEDCLLTARKLSDKNPLVLNMASRRNPGGGVEKGSGAQEECLFRSSNYYRTLYPLRYIAYPMERNYGWIYSPNVTVFRGLESDGYPLLEKPFKVNFVAVAALNRPNLDSNGKYTPDERKGMENKIHSILNVGLKYGHKVLILSAFGCGAFKNPPEQVAQLFKDILNEPLYKTSFSEIIFAIKHDHNDNRKTPNNESFLKVFA